MWRSVFFIATLAACMTPPKARAQVLGPCGSPEADKPTAAAPPATAAVPAARADAVAPIPLPGQAAPNFELTALVGDEVKRVKLSDYDGKWRVVCFYPADFTFV